MDIQLTSFYCKICAISFIDSAKTVFEGVNLGRCPQCNQISINLANTKPLVFSNSTVLQPLFFSLFLIFSYFIFKITHNDHGPLFIIWIGITGIFAIGSMFSDQYEICSNPFIFKSTTYFLWLIPIKSRSYNANECQYIEHRTERIINSSDIQDLYHCSIYLIKNNEEILIQMFYSYTEHNEHCEYWAHSISALCGLPLHHTTKI